jgi:hypothetical protein
MEDIDPDLVDETDSTRAKPLSHGSHWQALGLEGDDLLRFVMGLVQKHHFQQPRHKTPWPGGAYPELARMDVPFASVGFVALAGVAQTAEPMTMLSAYPAFARASEWVVNVEEATDSYGPYEGTVIGTVACGHCIEWFATDFELRAEQWRGTGLVRVALVGLALDLVNFAAEPWSIREGPMIEEKKKERRAQGRHAEADDPDLQVTLQTTSLRTLFSADCDHHELVGRVLSVTPIKPLPAFRGWRLEVECLPDQMPSGHRLIVYVFPPAWKEAKPPRKGQLVHGTIWLQGSWIGGAPEENDALWKQSEPV